MDCRPPGFFAHGILQARVLEWVTVSFSRGSVWPGDRMWVSCIAGRSFTVWATKVALVITNYTLHSWRRKWLPTPVFLPGNFHRQRSLAGYSAWSRRVRHDLVIEHADSACWKTAIIKVISLSWGVRCFGAQFYFATSLWESAVK